VAALCVGANQGFVVNWLLSESDPTDWRGEAVLVFPSDQACDRAYELAPALTEVHVQWQDVPGAPPLGALLTEQALMQAFSRFGMVVSARIPRKAMTREPHSFAFISFLEREDAQRVASKPEVEVNITPTWALPLRARLAKYGHASDKRVAVRVGDSADTGLEYDWVHICRR